MPALMNPYIFLQIAKDRGEYPKRFRQWQNPLQTKSEKDIPHIGCIIKITAGNILLRKERQYGNLEVKGLVG